MRRKGKVYAEGNKLFFIILLQQRQNQIYAKRLNTKKRLQSRYEKAYNL